MDSIPSDPSAAAKPRPTFARWLGTSNDVTRAFLAAGSIPGLINMAGGMPAAEIYPVETLAEIARRVILDHPAQALGYGPIEGLPELRDALARRYSADALQLTRDNILVTSSGMQGIELIGKVLLDQGSVIAGQFPTYLGALDAWRPRAPKFRNLVLDTAGFDPVSELTGAQFAYTVPNFSNPTGKLVDVATREKLVDAAHRTGTWLVEDDPYGALHYDTAPLPHMIALSARAHPGRSYDGPVVYLGTLSKDIAPGLRVGWVIAAPEMIAALTLAKQGTDLCTSGVTQWIALGALEAALIEQSRPKIIDLYRRRRDALCAAMSEHLSGWFQWEVPAGGMFVWAVARDPALDTDVLLTRAIAAGVCVTPSSVFDATGQNRRAIRLNFTFNAPDKLTEGVRRLAGVLNAMHVNRN